MGDDMTAPLISNQRQLRPGDVSSPTYLPEYNRPNEREYPAPTRKKSGPTESAGFDYYVGYAPEHEQPLPYVEYFTSFPCLLFAITSCLNPLLCVLRLCFAYLMLENILV
jgi:hypothetical protein